MSHKIKDLPFFARGRGVSNPGDLGSPLLDWWRAYDLGLSDGTNVGSWTGHTNAVVVTQGSSTSQPDYKTAIINGKDVLRFIPSAGDDSLFLAADRANKTDLALIVVVKNMAQNGSAGPCFMNSLAALAGYWGIDSGTKIMKIKNTAGTIYSSSAALSAAIGAANMLAVIITGGNIKFYEKRTLLSTVAHASNFTIGRFGDFGPSDADMDLAEAVIVDGVLQESDLFAMYDSYFQPTYAL